MICVLQIITGLSRGGLETFVMNVYRSIDRTKIQFDFLVNQKGGDYVEEVKSLGANIYFIPARNKGFLDYSRNLDKFFKENAHKYAVVHQHAATLSSVEPLVYAKKYGVEKRIIHAHSSSLSGKSKLHYILHNWYKLRIGNIATHYFVCSGKANEWFFGHTKLSNKSKMINNGIDAIQYIYNEDTRKKIREEFNIGEKNIVLGHVGRFMFVKNHKFLIDAFSEFHNQHPDSKLMLVGTGELKEELENKVKSLGLVDDVIFTGVRSDVNHLMQAMDAFVMPSLFEGLPMVLVEAQATGLLCVCSDTISTDAKLTDDIKWQPLHSTATEWAERIWEELQSHERCNRLEEIKDKGFDIKTTTNYLTSVYLN